MANPLPRVRGEACLAASPSPCVHLPLPPPLPRGRRALDCAVTAAASMVVAIAVAALPSVALATASATRSQLAGSPLTINAGDLSSFDLTWLDEEGNPDSADPNDVMVLVTLGSVSSLNPPWVLGQHTFTYYAPGEERCSDQVAEVSVKLRGEENLGSPVSVTIAGSSTLACVWAAPTSLSFGDLSVGSTSELTVQLSVAGATSADVTDATITGPFALVSPVPTFSIASGTPDTLHVSFTPNSEGAAAGTLSLVTDASNSPTVVTLSGTGIPRPEVAGVTPWHASTTGGATIAVDGAHFGSTIGTISIGGNACTPTHWTDTRIECVLPEGEGAAQDVHVVAANGGTSLEAKLFSYDAPEVLAVAPGTGPLTGRITLTVAGRNFGKIPTVTVTVGGADCPVASKTHTAITCTLPAGTGRHKNVKVTATGQSSVANGLFDYSPPIITSFSPASGPAIGEELTLEGEYFAGGDGTEAPTVKIGTASCAVLTYSPTRITCAASGVGAGFPVSVTLAGQTTVAPNGTYAFIPPSVVGIDPTHGPTSGGSAIQISATNYGDDPIVFIGSIACSVISWLGGTINAIVPVGEGKDLSVTVVTANGSASVANTLFSYDPPTVATVKPSSGPALGGTELLIHGSNFGPNPAVLIGDNECELIQIDGDDLVCTAPAGDGAKLTITVIAGNQQATLDDAFSYDVPSISSIAPNHGPTEGGLKLVIKGASFSHEASVTVGGHDCAILTTVDDQIECTLPAGAGNNLDVVVTINGQTAEGKFNYDPPSISEIGPTTAPAAGGALINISGEDFGDAPTVKIGNNECPVLVSTQTLIICQVAEGLGTALNVEVTLAGQKSTANTLFSYEAPICEAGSFSPNGATACAQCDVGNAQPAPGQTSCVACEPGTYVGLAGATACSQCEAGFYSSEAEASECLACPVGDYQPFAGRSECLHCPAGTVSLEGSASCTPCDAGTYQAAQSKETCTSCPAGTMSGGGAASCSTCPAGTRASASSGATSCITCAAGTFSSDPGSTACTNCPEGSYQPIPGSAICLPCEPGTIAATAGSAFCSACLPGEFRPTPNGSACTACAAGTYSPASGAVACSPCEVGFHQSQTGRTMCVACDAGYYQAQTGKADCIACDAGAYQDATGQVACLQCPAGVVAAAAGQASCTPCQPGEFAAPTGNACVQCREGYYQPRAGADSCMPCAPGTYATQKGNLLCLPCPVGAASSAPGSISCNTCPAGTFAAADATECAPCPDGTYQATPGSSACVACPFCDDGSGCAPRGCVAATGACENSAVVCDELQTPPFIVTTTEDDNDGACGEVHCTLREAIAAANATSESDVISFALAPHAVIKLLYNLPVITAPIELDGPGADLLTIDGNLHAVLEASGVSVSAHDLSLMGSPRVATVDSVATLELLRCIVRDNDATAAAAGSNLASGAIIESTGSLVLTNTIVRDNVGVRGIVSSSGSVVVDGGGFVHNVVAGGTTSGGAALTITDGSAVLTNATLRNNAATNQATDAAGGAVRAEGNADVEISFSTLAGNSANLGGALAVASGGSGSVILKSTIIAGNTADTGPDCVGAVTSAGGNVIGSNAGCSMSATGSDIFGNVAGGVATVDADLMAPASAQALVLLPRPTSPALNLGAASVCTSISGAAVDSDARGKPRPRGAGCDAGAVELQPTLVAITVTPSASHVVVGGVLTYTVTVSNEDTQIDAQSVLVTLTLPTAVTLVSTSLQEACSSDDAVLRCEVGTLAAGENKLFQVVTRAHGTAELDLLASVTAADYNAIGTSGTTLLTGAAGFAPIASTAALSTLEDTPLAVSLSATDADGDALTYEITTAPLLGVLLGTGATRVYVPNAHASGVDSFTFGVTDGTARHEALVTITVEAANDAPVAYDAAFNADVDEVAHARLHGFDVEGDALTFTLASAAAHGEVVLDVEGAVTYTPSQGYIGPDAFSFVVDDGHATSNVATVSIDVGPNNNHRPMAVGSHFSAKSGVAVSGALVGVDIEPGTLIFALVTEPILGTVDLQLDGIFTYLPGLDAKGVDSFEFRVTDQSGLASTATVTIDVKQAVAPPASSSTSGCNATGQGAGAHSAPIFICVGAVFVMLRLRFRLRRA